MEIRIYWFYVWSKSPVRRIYFRGLKERIGKERLIEVVSVDKVSVLFYIASATVVRQATGHANPNEFEFQ